MNLPLVLIIGRANVGKSAIFNAIVGRRQALISKIPGTTRDANFELIKWRNAHFRLGDSAGLEHLSHVTHIIEHGTKKTELNKNSSKLQAPSSKSVPLEHLIEIKTLEHLKEAAYLVIVVDGEDGLMPQDREIMKFLRQQNLSFTLVVNKIDGKADEPKARDFLGLNIQPTILTSAITRRGIGDLLDHIATSLPSDTLSTNHYPLTTKRIIHVALIGRTNVGKSTLTNTLSESNEMIVSSTPHTTREPHAKRITLDDRYDIELVDTAGVRKKAKIDHFLEIAGVRMSLELLKKVDVVLFAVDISENLSSQDLALARLIADQRKSCIILGNKWDLVKQGTRDMEHGTRKDKNNITLSLSKGIPNKKTKPHILDPKPAFEKYIYSQLNKLTYAPLLLISAQTGDNIKTVKPLIKSVFENAQTMFEPEQVKTILRKSLKLQPPPIVGEKKRAIEVRGLYQNPLNPKEYILKVYTRDYTPPNFVSFIEKQLRQTLPLQGVPSYITVENEHKGK